MKPRWKRRKSFMDGIQQEVVVPGFVKGDKRFVFDEPQKVVQLSDIDYQAAGRWEEK